MPHMQLHKDGYRFAHRMKLSKFLLPLAAKEVINVIAKTTMEKTGTFQSFDGTDLPW